jgi:hypothetical protein
MKRQINVNKRHLTKILLYSNGFTGVTIKSNINNKYHHINLLKYLFKHNILREFDAYICLKYAMINNDIDLFSFALKLNVCYTYNQINIVARHIFINKMYDFMHIILPFIPNNCICTIVFAITYTDMKIIDWHQKYAPHIFTSKSVLLCAITHHNYHIVKHLTTCNIYPQQLLDKCVISSVSLKQCCMFELLLPKISIKCIVDVIEMLTKNDIYLYEKHTIFKLLSNTYNNITFRHKLRNSEFKKKYILTIDGFYSIEHLVYYM